MQRNQKNRCEATKNPVQCAEKSGAAALLLKQQAKIQSKSQKSSPNSNCSAENNRCKIQCGAAGRAARRARGARRAAPRYAARRAARGTRHERERVRAPRRAPRCTALDFATIVFSAATGIWTLDWISGIWTGFLLAFSGLHRNFQSTGLDFWLLRNDFFDCCTGIFSALHWNFDCAALENNCSRTHSPLLFSPLPQPTLPI